jgi:hypothetical protein
LLVLVDCDRKNRNTSGGKLERSFEVIHVTNTLEA